MKKKDLLAVIDIGSLTTAMKVFSLREDQAPLEVESLRAFLPMGSNTYRNGSVSAADIEELCQILLGFRDTVHSYKAVVTICVATSALREAKNRDFAVEQIRLRTGFSVEILDNSMERFYRNLVMKETTDGFADLITAGTVILDIGSGSIQSTVYNESSIVFSQNMLLGPLRIGELYSGLSRETPDPQSVLEEHISRVLEDYHAIAPKGIQYKSLVVCGDETAYLKALIGKDPQRCERLSMEEFTTLCHLLEDSPVSELVLGKHIPSPAAGLLWPMALLTRKTLEYGRIDAIFLAAISLSDGIAYHYAHKQFHFPLRFDLKEDVLMGARNMGKRYRYDKKHSERVRSFAVAIFDNIHPLHGLSGDDRLLLEVAAILYEVGKHIQVSNFHLRSFHIIETTEILGLSREDQRTIANIVRFCGQTGLLSDRYFQYMPPDERNRVSKLSAILSLADALEASRKQKIIHFQVTCTVDSLSLECDYLTDISYECWEFNNRKALFFEVYGVTPELKIKRVIK